MIGVIPKGTKGGKGKQVAPSVQCRVTNLSIYEHSVGVFKHCFWFQHCQMSSRKLLQHRRGRERGWPRLTPSSRKRWTGEPRRVPGSFQFYQLKFTGFFSNEFILKVHLKFGQWRYIFDSVVTSPRSQIF